MNLTLAPYEKKTINSSGGIFTVLALVGAVELSAKGIEEIPLELSDQIRVGDVKQITLQNVADSEAVIEYVIASNNVDKKSQSMRISNDILKVEMDRDVNIGAVNQDGKWLVGIESGNINQHLPIVTCAVGQATLIAPLDVNRKELRINVDGDQPNGIFIGGAGIGANQGGFVDVGVTDYMPTQGALYAFNSGSESVNVNLLSIGSV